MSFIKDRACIVGIGHTPYVRGSDAEPNNFAIQLRAAEAAIENAGLKASQIDLAADEAWLRRTIAAVQQP